MSIWSAAMTPVRAVGKAWNELDLAMQGSSPQREQRQKELVRDIQMIKEAGGPNSQAGRQMLAQASQKYNKMNFDPSEFAPEPTPHEKALQSYYDAMAKASSDKTAAQQSLTPKELAAITTQFGKAASDDLADEGTIKTHKDLLKLTRKRLGLDMDEPEPPNFGSSLSMPGTPDRRPPSVPGIGGVPAAGPLARISLPKSPPTGEAVQPAWSSQLQAEPAGGNTPLAPPTSLRVRKRATGEVGVLTDPGEIQMVLNGEAPDWDILQ